MLIRDETRVMMPREEDGTLNIEVLAGQGLSTLAFVRRGPVKVRVAKSQLLYEFACDKITSEASCIQQALIIATLRAVQFW